MRANDVARVPPGCDGLLKLSGAKQNLILLDEAVERSGEGAGGDSAL